MMARCWLSAALVVCTACATDLERRFPRDASEYLEQIGWSGDSAAGDARGGDSFGGDAMGGDAMGGDARGGDTTVLDTTSPFARYLNAGSGWNDYVQGDGLDPLNGTDAPCDAQGDGPDYHGCIHAGEVRQFDVDGVTSCTDITASDALGAFRWVCDGSSNPVRMVSTGLVPSMGLRDLIDFDLGEWKPNALTVLQTITTVLETPAEVWWKTPVRDITASGGLDEAGSVYIVSAATTRTFSINEDRTALVIRLGVSVSESTDIVSMGGDFTWFEGTLQSNNVSTAVSVSGLFSVLNHVRVNGTLQSNGVILSSSKNRLRDIVIDVSPEFAGCGLCAAPSSSHNSLVGYRGPRLSLAGTNNIFAGLTTHGTQTDLVGSGHIMVDALVTGYFESTATASVGMALTCANGNPCRFSGGANSWSSVAAINSNFEVYGAGISFADVGAMAVGWSDFHVGAQASGITFTGAIVVGADGCSVVEPGDANIANATCAGADSVRVNADFTNTIVGKVDDDATNPAPTGTLAALSINNWSDFDNRNRMWGADGVFPSEGSKAGCVTGATCRIWDYSLALGDTGDPAGSPVLLDVLTAPNESDAATHTWLAGNAGDCEDYRGAQWTGSACVSTFLRRAVELFDDGVGNDNGLCEVGEDCSRTPNIGAYQGHGTLVEIAVLGGAFAGTRLFEYDVNGR